MSSGVVEVASINDIFQFVTTATLFGHSINNVYHYKLTTLGSGDEPAQELALAWLATVMPDLRDVMTESMVFTGFYTVNLGHPEDFDYRTGSYAGTIETSYSPGQPSWMTLVFRYNRVSAGDRNGYKKIAGVTENNTAGNAWSGDGSRLTEIESAFESPLSLGAGTGYVWKPFVAHRPIAYGTNPTGYIPSSVSYSKLSTQRSRL